MPPRRAKSQSVASDAPWAPASSTSPPASPKPATKTPKASHSRSTSLTSRSSPVATRAVVPKAPQAPESTLPSVLRFLLVIVLSLSLSALLYSLTSHYTAGDLASVSKSLETWPEVSGVLGWQVIKLGVLWFSQVDALDTISLATLLNYPSHVLLWKFYGIRPTTELISIAINLASTTLPFYLLRPTAAIHSSDPSKQRQIPRLTRTILSDPATTLSTSLLATAIVAVILQFSYATFLPSFLITHFTGIRTLDESHRGPAGLLSLLVALSPLGLAAREYLFVSSAASTPTAAEKHYSFNPSKATLRQTIWHNSWGWYTAKEKALIRRTALAVALVGAETAIQVWGTIKGVELEGAVGWAGLWAAAIAVVGFAFAWVEGPADV